MGEDIWIESNMMWEFIIPGTNTVPGFFMDKQFCFLNCSNYVRWQIINIELVIDDRPKN